MAEVDWTKIKNEYVTTAISQRDLAKKYGIPSTTVFKRSKADKWVECRERFCRKSEAKAIDKTIETQTLLYELAYNLAKQLNDIASKGVPELAAVGLKPRDITAAAKDCAELMHLKDERDIREQEARIANLRKQAESADEASKQITITIAGSAEDYAQ